MGRKRPKKQKTVEEKDEDPEGRRWLVKVGFALLVVELAPVLFVAWNTNPWANPNGWDSLGDLFTYIVFGLPVALIGTAVALPLVFIRKYQNIFVGTPLLANSLWMFFPGATMSFARFLALVIAR